MKDLKTALWCDLTTDEERSAWLLLGRGYETGVVAKAIQNDLARAYQRLGAIMSGDHNQYRKPDRKCDRCGKVNPAEIHTCTPKQEPVAHSVIAGALFDFMGWLTSRKERIVLSSADNASPAVEVITEFAKMRGLSLDDAKVQDWNTTPPQHWSDCAVHSEPAEIHTCTPRESCCAECGKRALEGWALYCVECSAPMREWVGLTDEDKNQIAKEAYNKVELTAWELAQRVGEFTEAKLKEKNT